MNKVLTDHVKKRAAARNISPAMFDAAFAFGDVLRTNGSLYYFMGKRAVKRMLKVYTPPNPDRYRGLVVVCDPLDLMVITAYKNINWPKKIHNKRS